MIILRLDKNGGINKGDIKAFEHDNKSETYTIQLYKNNEVYDLTNKTVELTIVEKKRKYGDMVTLPVESATEGKVKLEIVTALTKQDGTYDFKLTVKDTAGLIETFPNFQVKIDTDITKNIAGEIVADKNFTILTEGLKALSEYEVYKTNAKKVPDIEKNVADLGSQLDNIETKKADKTTIWTMANMGQDVKTAMTGGSVAVVGGNAILEENIVDNQVTLPKINLPFLNGFENISYNFILSKSILGSVLATESLSPSVSAVYNFTSTENVKDNGFKIDVNKKYKIYAKFKVQGIENITADDFTVSIGFKNGWLERKLSDGVVCNKNKYINESISLFVDLDIPSSWTNIEYQQVCIPYLMLSNLGETDVSLVKCVIEKYVCVENSLNVSEDILSNYINVKYYPIVDLPNKTLNDIKSNLGTEDIKQRVENLENNIPKSNKNVVTIGDSLTGSFNYPSKLQELLGDSYNVLNYGIGGETSATIASRIGGMCMYVNNITIPSTTTPVIIGNSDDGIPTNDNRFNAKPLLQVSIDGLDGGVNPVIINGIEGTITYNSSDKNYSFTRVTSGEQLTINRPTMIITKAMRERKNDYVNVMWIGANGGYYVYDPTTWDIKDNFRHLIGQYKALIKNGNMGNYIILGLWLPSTNPTSTKEKQLAEDELLRAFGRNFLNIRKYLVDYGLSDLGISPTQEDVTAISLGNIPPSLLRDTVHLTSQAFELVAQQVYKRGQELGYW